MYQAFYGLTERPFNLTPDPRYLFLSEKHKEAFAHLMFGIKNRTGFVMVTGEIGTGKTTICRSLLNQLDSDTEVAFIFNPYLSPEELLRKINEDFGIESRAQSVKELIDELNGYLLDRAAHGKNCVLVIDESQDLTPGVLEQIRLLSNLETETQKLLQIVLIGQPELARNLQLNELRQLNQRITARYHLKPLNREETVQYVAYRLHVAGGHKKVHFTRSALRTIYRLSGGTPRVINAICDRALLIGYTREIRGITSSVVRRAAKEIRGETVRAKGSFRAAVRRFLPNPTWVGTAAAVLVLIALFTPVWRWLRTPPPPQPSNQASATVQRDEPAVAKTIVAEPKPEPSPVELPAPPPAKPAETAAPDAETKNMQPPPVTPEPAKPESAKSETPVEPPSTPALTAEAIAQFDRGECRAKAIAAIMRAWNLAIVGGVPQNDSNEAIIDFAQANGVSHEVLTPTVEELMAIGLPALVRIRTAKGEAWIGLMRVDGDQIHITTDTEPAILTRDVFRKVFANEAVIYWRDSDRNARVMKKGMIGKDIERLQQQLTALGRLSAPVKGEYDDKTARAVAKLQAETGITIDGIAGKQIRMILSSLLGDTPTPSLDEKLSETKRSAKHVQEPEAMRAPKPEDATKSSLPEPALKKEEPHESPPPAPEPKSETSADSPNAGSEPKPEKPSESAPAAPEPKKEETPESTQTPLPAASSPQPGSDSGQKVGVEELAPPPHDDQLAPPKVEPPKEVTPPLTVSPPLVPRESNTEASKEEPR